MRKWLTHLWLGGVVLLGLVACTPSGGEGTDTNGTGDVAEPRLSDGYENALSIEGQLALGTVRLDDTDLAVTEAQAAELLPLWQALQTLSSSDTAATVEIDAVVNQLQDTMSPEQIEAIAGMALTTDSLAEMLQSGELNLGFGRAFANPDAAGGGNGFPGGGFAFGGIPDGGPGGGFPGGGPGGGFPGGGPGGRAGGDQGGAVIVGPGSVGDLNEDDLATRQAARESGDFAAFQERALFNMAIRLLQEKTGETPEDDPRLNMAAIVFTAISEATGLDTEEIQSQMAPGISLAEIIATNGGNVTVVHDAIVDALKEFPNAADLDVDQLVDQWLNRTGE